MLTLDPAHAPLRLRMSRRFAPWILPMLRCDSACLDDEDNAWALSMTYGPMHRITGKNQGHMLNGLPVNDNTYNHDYNYELSQPNALSKIDKVGGEENFTYDLNGNMLSHGRDDGESRRMAWDESNRLKAVNIAGAAIQHAVYDATSERALKGHGSVVALAMNGKKYQYAARMGNYVRYVSGYTVVDRYGQVSKHYYAGSERIASRLAGRLPPLWKQKTWKVII